MLTHLEQMVAPTALPVNADFENGFGKDAAGVAESVKLAVATGVAGLSIEDSTADSTDPLFPLDAAVERLRAARQVIDEAGGDTMLIARAENFFVGVPDLEDTLRRLKAYAAAGCRLSLRTGTKDARADRRGSRSSRAEAGQCPGGLEF